MFNSNRAVTTFDTDSVTHYEYVHGRKPKGKGTYMFSLGRRGAYTTYEYTGTFTDAKRAAMREARMLGCETFGVAS